MTFWHLFKLALFKLALFVFLVISEEDGCGSEWFGSSCQYKCRCTDNLCDVNGACTNSSRCQVGTFGPSCQYVDLTQEGNLSTSPATSSVELVTDGNDMTCLNDTIGSVSVRWSRPNYLTWIRVQLLEADSFTNIVIKLKKSVTSESLKCINQSTSVFDEKTIDIHCQMNVTVQQVTVSWTGFIYLCSLYISGGRNVALRQSTTQSTTYGEQTSDKAVEGDTRADMTETCSSTDTGDPSPSWKIMFTHPRVIYKFVVYNRQDDCCRDLLNGFILTSFLDENTQVFQYTNQEQSLPIYNVIPEPLNLIVSHVQINATRDTINELVVSLCEVEIYGDSACAFGKYGRQCEHSCNCARNETCFVSNGGCPSRCADGFFGKECREVCPDTRYGPDCSLNCSQFCIWEEDRNSSVCHHVNGTCLLGCQEGYQGYTCDAVITTDEKTSDRITIGVTVGILLLVAAASAVGVGIYCFCHRSRNIVLRNDGHKESARNMYIQTVGADDILHEASAIYIVPIDRSSSEYNNRHDEENVDYCTFDELDTVQYYSVIQADSQTDEHAGDEAASFYPLTDTGKIHGAAGNEKTETNGDINEMYENSHFQI